MIYFLCWWWWWWEWREQEKDDNVDGFNADGDVYEVDAHKDENDGVVDNDSVAAAAAADDDDELDGDGDNDGVDDDNDDDIIVDVDNDGVDVDSEDDDIDGDVDYDDVHDDDDIDDDQYIILFLWRLLYYNCWCSVYYSCWNKLKMSNCSVCLFFFFVFSHGITLSFKSVHIHSCYTLQGLMIVFPISHFLHLRF